MLDASNPAALLDHAASVHERLAKRARKIEREDLEAILSLVAAVVIHGLFEGAVVFDHDEYVAPQAQEKLAREHAEFADALGLMEELAATSPDSSDLRTLSRVILEKVVQHIERDQRTIYGSLARLNAMSRGDAAK